MHSAAYGYDAKGKDGEAGYFRFLAESFPREFAAMVRAVVPPPANPDVDEDGFITIDATANVSSVELNLIVVPSGKFIDFSGAIHDPISGELRPPSLIGDDALRIDVEDLSDAVELSIGRGESPEQLLARAEATISQLRAELASA
jgi:hypothetical protein